MAKKSNSEKERPTNESSKVADIITASKSLAEGKSYENGYPDKMKVHINRGSGARKVRGE